MNASDQDTNDTAKLRYSGDVKEFTGECNNTLLSSVMKEGSVCMQVMDVHTVCTM